VVRTAPLTRKVTVPPSTTSGIVSTPVTARTSTPAGTCTAKVLVLWAAVDMVPGTEVTSALAGVTGATRAVAGRLASTPVSAHAPQRRRPSSRIPRTTTSWTTAVATVASVFAVSDGSTQRRPAPPVAP
jgi:hypothetical protein